MFESLLAPHRNHLEDCFNRKMFGGKRVLEVGGSIPVNITQNLKVKKWHCVDIAFTETKDLTDNYRQIKASILDYSCSEKFDFIIATNSFEHIVGLEDGLSNMYELLEDDGCLSALLGPVWSCYKGHHVWLPNNSTPVTFNDIKIPDWGHLLYTPEELKNILFENYPENTVDALLKQLVNWDFLNYLFFEDYVKIVNNSKFVIREFRDWHESKYPPPEIQQKLEAKYNKKNFSTVSIKMILQK